MQETGIHSVELIFLVLLILVVALRAALSRRRKLFTTTRYLQSVSRALAWKMEEAWVESRN